MSRKVLFIMRFYRELTFDAVIRKLNNKKTFNHNLNKEVNNQW